MNPQPSRPFFSAARTPLAAWGFVWLLGVVLVGCQTARLGDAPVLIDAGQLEPPVREAYRVLASSGSYLDQRTQAVVALVEDGTDQADEVIAWALEAERPTEVNQAVLQGFYSAPGKLSEALWWPMVGRLDTLPPALTGDFALASSRFEGGRYTKQLLELARSSAQPAPVRRGAIAALGQRRTKPVAEVLGNLTETTQPPAVRTSAFAALATLTGITTYGQDRGAWRQWWEDVRGLDAASWERQLTQNFVSRDAHESITNDQLVDRLIELNTMLHRLARPKDKPRVLTDLLGEQLQPLRELGMSLSEQRLSSGEPFDNPLRAALRQSLVAKQPALRQRAAVVLRDLADEPSADLVAVRLRRQEEHVDSVLRPYLLLLARMPRAEAVEAQQRHLDDAALQSPAAAALASAAAADMVRGSRAARIAKSARQILDRSAARPDPAVVTLLGRVGNDDDFKRIAGWLDHRDPTVRRAAAQAWADSDRTLVPLAERADDAVIQPIVITAAQRRGQDPQTLRTLTLFPPTQPTARSAWGRALVAMAGRVPQDQVLAASLALRDAELMPHRESLLTAAIDVQPPDAERSHAYMRLLLDRAELRLDDARPRLAILDFESLAHYEGRLTAAQRDRLQRGLISASLQTDQLAKAFGVARKLFKGPNGALIQPAPDDPVIDLFIVTASQHVQQGRRTQARRILEELRLLLGPKMKPQIALRISDIEERAAAKPEPAAPTASGTP